MAWSRVDENLYQKHKPVLSRVMREGFLGHRNGRTFTRHGIELDHVTSHEPRRSGQSTRVKRTNNTVFVLHYDAADFAAWHLKWYRRTFGDTTAAAIHDKRRMQQDMFRDAIEQGEEAVRTLFNDFFVFSESAIQEFELAGLIVKLELPSLKPIKQEIDI